MPTFNAANSNWFNIGADLWRTHPLVPPTPLVGIPETDGNVPSAIMPTLPLAAAQITAFPYNPTTLANPAFADGALQYYVDTDVTEPAGNSGRGSVAAPRNDLPGLVGNDWTIEEGWQIFITANSSFWDGDDIVVDVQGGPSTQCWVIGVGGQPKFRMDKFFMGGTHLIMENLHFFQSESSSKIRLKFGSSLESIFMQYGTLRNSKVQGQGNSTTGNAIGGAGLSDSEPSEFICIFNNEITEVGDHLNGPDYHGVQMTKFTRYWWIINNHIHKCGGDSVQINASSQQSYDAAERPHYIYVAGNEMDNNFENSFDSKNSFHAICSSNIIHDIYVVGGGSQANGVALIIANDSEGRLAGYQWAINNIIYNTVVAIKMAANAAESVDNPALDPPAQTAGQKCFAIGNLIYDTDSFGINLDCRGFTASGDGFRSYFDRADIILNTIVSGDEPIHQQRTNNIEANACNFIGNLTEAVPSGTDDWDILDGTLQTNTVDYNFIYRPGGSVSLPTGNFDSFVGNTLDTAPDFSNQVGKDFTLDAASDAIDISGFSTTPTAITLFNDMYGIDISKDILGVARPDVTLFDAGSYES